MGYSGIVGNLLFMCIQSQNINQYPTRLYDRTGFLSLNTTFVLCSVVPNSLRPHGLEPSGSSVHGIFQARKNTGLGCHFLFQRISLTQGLNPLLLHLLHWQMDCLPLYIGMWGWKILCCGDCLVDCRIFSSIPGPHPLNASRTLPRVMATRNVSRHCQASSGQGDRREHELQLINT